MAENKAELSLIVKALDKASGPIKSLTEKLEKANTPGRDLGKLFSGLSKELGPIQNLGSAFSRVGGSMRNVAGEAANLGLRVAGLAAGATFAFYEIVKGAVDAGDKLSEMAQRTGLAVDVYASLQYAAAQADVEQEQFNSAMDKFNKNLGEAKAGGGSLLEFLKKVSPRLAEQVKGAKSSEAALALMTDAFTKVTDPAKRAALSAAAFGKGGLQMGQFLGLGSKAIQEMQTRFIELSGSQQEFADQSSALDNVLRDTETALGGARNQIALKLYPAVTKIAKAVTDFVVKNRDGLVKWAESTGKAISSWVDGGGLDRLVDRLGALASGVGKVIDFLGPFGTALVGVGVFAAPLLAAIGGLGVSVVNLGVALVGAWPAIAAVGAALLPVLPIVLAVTAAVVGLAAVGYELSKNWDDLVLIFKDWARSIDQAIDKAGGLLNLLTPLGQMKFVGELLRSPDENSALTPEARARAERFANARPNNSTVTQNAAVSIDFANVPAGTKIRSSPDNTASLNMSVQPVMSGG